MRLSISAIILTYNEEANIEDCLKSIYDLVEKIFIVDSGSNDKTLEIVKKYTNNIFYHTFEGHSKQFNWALENLPIDTCWVMRLDADERLTKELAEEMCSIIPGLSEQIAGLYIKRRVYFMGKWIRFGAYYPIWLLRVWRHKKAYCEKILVDEHIQLLEGKAVFLKNDFIDENKKNLDWWIDKHNKYATMELIDNLLGADNKEAKIVTGPFGSQPQRKRWLKKKVYQRLPLFLRPFLYFIYRYFLRFGFLDGREGLTWHFLQGFWYRFLVDAKIYEIKKKAHENGRTIRETIEDVYKIKVEK